MWTRRVVLLSVLLAGATLSARAADWTRTAADRLELDLDGDGALERVQLTPTGLVVHLAEGAVRLPVAGTTLAGCDVNCDGRLDVVLDGGTTWLPNARLLGQDRFAIERNGDDLPLPIVWETTGYPLESTTRHLAGDFDGDGQPELVVADYSGVYPDEIATITVFERDTNDTWQVVWDYADGPRLFSAFEQGDTDRDGVPELIVGRSGGVYADTEYEGPRVYIFESDGDNNLVLDHLIEVDPSPGLASFALMDDLVVGDANDDGNVDIVVGLADNETLSTPSVGSRVHVFTYNEGAADYVNEWTHTQTNVSSFYLTALAVGDSDNDGHSEVTWFERIIPNVYQAEHRDNQFMVETSGSGIAAGLCLDVCVADVDADGLNELLCGGASEGDGHVYVLRAAGNGDFVPAFIDDAGIDNTVLYVDTDERVPPYIAGGAFSAQVYVTRFSAGAVAYPTLAMLEIDAIQCHEVTIGEFVPGGEVALVVTKYNGVGALGGYELRLSPPATCPGDADCSGAINWRDIDFFVAAQNDNMSAWAALFAPEPPVCPFENNDVNGDGNVNWRDIDPFVALQNTSCP